jgi:hypothetical protein
MKRLLHACLLAALASAAAAAGTPSPAIQVTLEPGKVHEHCLRLAMGESRRYHWKADGPVEFNIHYHVGERVEYPVKRGAMRGDGGTFKASSDQDYCWMWKAKGPKPATITGAVE